MKRLIFTLLIVMLGIGALQAARKTQLAPGYAWKLEPPLGLREHATIDTLPDNYSRRSVPGEVSDAWATTGNMGGAGINMIWTERPAVSDFFFRDGYDHWLPSRAKTRFYNTRIPMTLLSYNTGGGRDIAQDRLQATFSGNINARAQVGAFLDYLYSKGSYANQADKNLAWGASGSYLGDRYELQAFFYHYNLLAKNNGGITDPLYITDPALIQGGVSSVDTKSIPTRLSNAHTRVKGQEFYVNQRYKIGYYHEEHDSIDVDSVVSRTYIPVTSVIWTLRYMNDSHKFLDKSPGETRSFFENTYLNSQLTADRSTFSRLSNTVGLSLLEGFHRYAKFGLSGFITYDYTRYGLPVDSLAGNVEALTPWPEGIDRSTFNHTATRHGLWVGGQLTKQRGSLLRYQATARFGIAGNIAGEVHINGSLTTSVPLFGDSLSITAQGRFDNSTAPYFYENYVSNHFIWRNSFGNERRLALGGEVSLGRSDTHIEAEVSNIQNHLYFNSSFMPAQHGGNIQIVSARLRQGLHAGILHWDNQVTFQSSTDDNIISLPRIAVYSNLYLKFRVATLFVQIGVDCDYYTKYYAPKFQPATVAFANQHETKIGNYPFMNVYANCKLSKVRFYVMMSHINQGWFSRDYFSMPDYPLNPRRFQLGLSIDFAN